MSLDPDLTPGAAFKIFKALRDRGHCHRQHHIGQCEGEDQPRRKICCKKSAGFTTRIKVNSSVSSVEDED